MGIKKRVMSLLLCTAMAVTVLGGCGKQEDVKPASSGSDEGAAPVETEKEEDGQADQAGEEVSSDGMEPVSLRIVMYGDAGSRNVEFFKNEFHEKVLADTNIDMKVDLVPWGGGGDQIMTMAAAGEGFAFMSTVSEGYAYINKGLTAVFEGAMFDELAPNYKAARMGRGFDCAKYKGDILTIPCGAYPSSAQNDNFAIRNDILNQVGWDVEQIKSYDDLMAAIAEVHAAYPSMTIMKGADNLFKGLISVAAPDGALIKDTPIAVCVVDESKPDSDEVISLLESDYFKNYCAVAKEWFELGYLTTENLTDPTAAAAAWDSGNCLMQYGNPYAVYDHVLNNVEEADVQYLKIDTLPNLLMSDSNSAWMFTKPEQDKVRDWVRFFDWMYASKENYMLCLYGVEGQDWQYREDGSVETLTQDAFFYPWMHQTLFYDEISTERFDAEEVDAFIHFDDGAIYSKKVGFAFDETPVAAESAKIAAIVSEKVKPIAWGVGDYEKDFPAVLEELKEAGLDKYVEEYQKQFSEFMSSK